MVEYVITLDTTEKCNRIIIDEPLANIDFATIVWTDGCHPLSRHTHRLASNLGDRFLILFEIGMPDQLTCCAGSTSPRGLLGDFGK